MVVGIPAGAVLIRMVDAEVFRRICMSFDAWVVGIGLAKVLVTLGFVPSRAAYVVVGGVVVVDTALPKNVSSAA